MHKNKVITVLKSLSPEEMRLFDKFVRSPIHNQHEDVIRLFQYIRKHLGNGERALKKEMVFENLFPGEKFEMQKVHYISSYLLKVAEEFLAWQQWRNDKGNYQIQLLRALRKHRLDSLFENTINRTGELSLENNFRDISTLQTGYLMEQERFNHDRLKTGKQEFRLQEMSDTLDEYFIAEKLRIACILLSNQTVSKSSYYTGLLPQVTNFLRNHQYLENPAILVYYLASRTLENFEDDESYQQLKQLLEKNRKLFSLDELHDIYIFAINYCIRRFNGGTQTFMKEVFDIYRFGMETDAFLQDGVMTPRTYSNIVMSGLRANEFEWVNTFIYKYKPTLPEKQREGFFNYNLARLYYEQKSYKNAMPLLLQMDYEDVLLTCLGKILLAKMQFEQAETESLSNLLQSFKTYIQRKKMLGYHKESTLNFVQYLSKLNTRPPGSSEQLINEINATKVVAEKEWLLAQLMPNTEV